MVDRRTLLSIQSQGSAGYSGPCRRSRASFLFEPGQLKRHVIDNDFQVQLMQELYRSPKTT
jgi:hypothetical protein